MDANSIYETGVGKSPISEEKPIMAATLKRFDSNRDSAILGITPRYEKAIASAGQKSR
jgi:hypothetical protein